MSVIRTYKKQLKNLQDLDAFAWLLSAPTPCNFMFQNKTQD